MSEADVWNHISDEELLRRLQLDDQDAFDTLVRRYERELYGYLRRYLGDAHLADDVFQNTFLQVYIKRDQFELGRPVRPWIYTIATNQAIDAMRKVGRHATVSLDRQTGANEDGELRSLAELLEGMGDGPPEQSEREESRRRMRECVDLLPDFLRQVVILAYFQSLKYREIADILKIPVGTVKSRLHTALNKLHEFGELFDVSPALAVK